MSFCLGKQGAGFKSVHIINSVIVIMAKSEQVLLSVLSDSHPSIFRYIVPFITSGLALALTLQFPNEFERTPFLLFFAAVAMSAWYGGFIPGILASVLSLVLAHLFVLDLMSFQDALIPSIVRTVIFGVTVTLISFIERRHRRVTEALRSSHTELSLYLQNMSNGVLVQDKHGKLVYANYEAAKLMGFISAEALIGASMEELLTKYEIFDEDGEPLPNSSLPAGLALSGMQYPEAVLRYRFKDSGKDRWSYVKARPIFDASGEVDSAVSLFLDITELKQAQRTLTEQREQLRARVRQQEVIAELGLRALSGVDLKSFMQEALQQMTKTLKVEFAKLLELAEDGKSLLLVAGVGWKDGLVGSLRLDAGRDSHAGFTLLANEPVIMRDLRTEKRFNAPPLLREHEVVSGMSVLIMGDAAPWGVLGAHSREQRTFTRDDVYFLQAIGNLLASFLAQERIRHAEREQRSLAEALRNTAEALGGTLDLSQLLDRILENVERVLPHDAADIMLVTDKVAHVARYRGYDEFQMKELMATFALSLETTPTLHEMVTTGRALVIPDTQTYPGWLNLPKMDWLRSYISVPLIIDGNVEGFLNVSSVTPNALSDADVQRLQPFAAQSTVAIRNARLYAEAKGKRGS
jgi:PAS domain S-box-containing protein